MYAPLLPLPDEPRALKTVTRTLVEQSPAAGLRLVTAGEWIADPLWDRWGPTLAARGLDRDRFLAIVAGYGNELRLWVMGERPWQHCVEGLAGRVLRRLGADPVVVAADEPAVPTPDTLPVPAERPALAWRGALARVGLDPGADAATLVATIDGLGLLYDLAPDGAGRLGRTRHRAAVWAGARPRDPEACVGEASSAPSEAAALAESLGRFLLRDPAYPIG